VPNSDAASDQTAVSTAATSEDTLKRGCVPTGQKAATFELAAWVRASCACSRVPEKVNDREVLLAAVRLVLAVRPSRRCQRSMGRNATPAQSARASSAASRGDRDAG
jgi:hypothetical protein